MKKKRKALKIVLLLLALVAIAYLSYYLIHYYFYDRYKDYLSEYTVEEGTEFEPLSDRGNEVEGMVLVAENDNLKLYTDTATANIAVYDKRNGEVIYSNPIDADEDPIASATNRNYLKSQLIVEYFNANRALNTLDSYSMAVERGQVQAESIDNGIRYTYEMGDKSSTTGIVPIYIEADVLETVLSNLDDDGKKYVGNRYKESAEAPGMLELNDASRSGASTLRKLNGYFEEGGFTEEMYVEQMGKSGVDGAVPLSITIAIEYRLEEESLRVSVPMSEVQEIGGAMIYRIQVLRYMGASGTSEEGYMVVPNGSGSLIYFNNGKTNVANYTQYIYGMDMLSQDYTVLENTENARFPMYGICRNDSSILASIEDGASLCYLTAGVAGKVSNYNAIYPTFVLRGFDKLSMFGTTGNEADVPVVEKDFYDVNLEVQYTFLTEEDKGYVGLANYYRNRLVEEGLLVVQENQNDEIPFYYDVIGGVKETASILGKQYLRVNPITTFAEAGEISSLLMEEGISNQVMNFQGWFNGGFYHDVPDRIRVIAKLGGKNGLEELSTQLREQGGKFYADVAFQKVTFISKRFEYTHESSRYYGAGYVAAFGATNPGNLRQTSSLTYREVMFDLLSPKFLVRYIQKFADRIERYDIDGIALRDMGDLLYSDKKRTELINREESLDIVIAQLQTLQETEKNLMMSGGNEYALAYATDLINVSLEDNNYFLVDEEIPLFQMIVHGSIDYGCGLVNLGDTFDTNEIILQLIATGASPHFVFSWDGSNDLKYTGLLMYYATDFNNWKDIALQVYHETNAVLKEVIGETIVDHQIMEAGITKTTYSNGVSIYVNTTTTDVTFDGVAVRAKSYVMEGQHE